MRTPLLPLACLGLALAACDPGIELGTRCEYNSDCTAGLACVNGLCGEECRAHRDCPLQSECLLTDDGRGRCQLPEDTCEQCAAGLVCGADDLCHSPCGAQCPSDGVCVSGACVRPSADAGATPSDAGASELVPHVACTNASTCAAGQACVRDAVVTTAVCRTPCSVDGECGDGPVCARLEVGETRTYCSIPCDPVTGAGCPTGEGCDLLERQGPDLADGGPIYLRFWGCRAITPGATTGAPCSSASQEDCDEGYSCTYSAAGGSCTRYCVANTGGGENPLCATGERCNAFDLAPLASGERIGFCDARPL